MGWGVDVVRCLMGRITHYSTNAGSSKGRPDDEEGQGTTPPLVGYGGHNDGGCWQLREGVETIRGEAAAKPSSMTQHQRAARSKLCRPRSSIILFLLPGEGPGPRTSERS